jgi:hypothetical protein
VEFATIMLFDTLEQVRAFAGEDDEAAYVPPRARAVLARFDGRSAHYQTPLRPRGGRPGWSRGLVASGGHGCARLRPGSPPPRCPVVIASQLRRAYDMISPYSVLS